MKTQTSMDERIAFVGAGHMAGALVGVIFMLALPVYQGFGGKLGTIASCAVLLTMLVFG